MTYRALELKGPFKRHPSPGRCIYCDDTTSPRTEEHVLPYAIAGNMLVFEDACCPTCQKKILEFEQPTLQESFKHIRYKIGAPSRSKSKGKKKKKAKRLPTLDSGHVVGAQIYVTEQTQLSQLDHPIGFIGLRLTPPKILQGITVLSDAPVDGFGAIDQEKLKQFAKYNNSIISIAAINPSFFARFLAKVAFGYAYAELKNTFVPIILPLIRGNRNIFTDLVGGDYEIPLNGVGLHELQLFKYDFGPITFQCVRLRLFSSLGTPNYHVVVGFIPNECANDYEDFLKSLYIDPFIKVA